MAQQAGNVFNHITEKEGLSYNIVNCFLKDSRGMLWIGTYNGLNRYDGAHFYTFHSGAEKNTLPNNTVHKLAEDKKGNIWGTTDKGIFCLDVFSGKFRNYRMPGNEKWPGVLGISCDNAGRVWATSHAYLALYNAQADSFGLAPGWDKTSLGTIAKNGLLENPDGKGLWVAGSKGLQYYDKGKAQYISTIGAADSNVFNNHSASALCKTSEGYYWYYNNAKKQIIAFDPLTKTSKNIIAHKELQQLRYDVATLFEDSNHTLWLCTWGYELFMIEYRNGIKITPVRNNKNDITSIAGDFFWDAMEEADGTVWFGTVGGISKCNPSRSFYKIHQLPAEAHFAQNPSIALIKENPLDKSWWIITSKNNLVHYHPITGISEMFSIANFTQNKNKKTPEYNNNMIFYKDSVLLFSHTGAWVKKGKGNFMPLQLKPPFDDWVLRDAALYKGHILYASTRYKLLQWNLHTGQKDSLVFLNPTMIDAKPPRLQHPVVNSAGRVWMMSGLDWLAYTDNNELKQIKMNYQHDSEDDVGYFTDIAIDGKGLLWMTKKGDGLISYNPATNTSKQIKQHDGLVMDHVMAVTADSSGKIWTGAYNQFSVYNPLLNSFYNFTLPVSANNYAYVNFLSTLVNGNIIANIGGEVLEFFTERLKAPQVKGKPLISMVAVNGVDTNLYYYNAIGLQPTENSLRLKFGMLTDNATTPYDMLYILEGAEKKWTTASVNFEANYNSLPSGDYTFKVKALAKDKSWQTAETILQIHIATPFYKAWWFLFLVALLLFAVIFSTYRYRIAQKERMMRLEGKAQLLEKEKTQVMYENLKQHLNPHFLFNSLTSLSSLIRIDQKMAGNFLDKMSKVYRYILKNRDNETVPLADEIKFVQLYIDLQKTRFEAGLIVNVDISEAYYHRRIAPVTLQNLVENSIKHNTADADTPLQIHLYVQDEYLVVKNNLQRKSFVETSNKQGLGNMQSLYRFLSNRAMLVQEDEKCFIVKVPLI